MTAAGVCDDVLVEPAVGPGVADREPAVGRTVADGEVAVGRAITDRAASSHRRAWRRAVFALLGATLIAEILVVAPYLAPAVSDLDSPDPGWLVVAVVSELVSMNAFARVQRRMLAAGGARVPMRRMAALTYAANALSVSLPGGSALSLGYVFKRLRSWGATVPAAGFTILSSGVLSTVSFALLVVVGGAFAGQGGLSSLLVVGAALVAAAAGLIARRHYRGDLVVRVAGRVLALVNRILRRAPEAGLAGVQRIAEDLSAIHPRHRDWLAGLGLAGVNWVADLACLVACCRAVGAEGSSLVLVTVAYVAGMSTSSLSLLPGGLGVVDAAMILALTEGGVGTVPATAGVLLYRLISFALVVAIGWAVWGATWMADRRTARACPEVPIA